jgi:hypothetical protein
VSTSDDAVKPEVTVPDVARWLAALAMLGAAVIHFAFAPAHLSDQTSHGLFFLVVAWAQLLGAIALGFDWRPQRPWLLGTAALNTVVAVVWLISRTWGLPGQAAEGVGFPDTLATVLEVTAVVAALAVAYGWLSDRAVERPSFAVAGVPTLAVVAIVTASVIPALGGGHDHGDGAHGQDAASGDAANNMAGMTAEEMAQMGGGAHAHDAGTGTAAAAATPANWDQTRMEALEGYLPKTEINRLLNVNEDYLTGLIVERSRALRDVPASERDATIAKFVKWSVGNALTAENGSHSSMPSMHQHGIVPWQNITDPAQQAKLQGQLQQAGTVMAKYPTAAAAMKAGYFQVTPYVPGIGAHYLNVGKLTDNGFNPADPEMLLYNGNEPTAKLIGLSYAVLADKAPSGFIGPNDMWHNHPSLCIVGNIVVGPDSTPESLCSSIGGRKGTPFEHTMWMAHLWQVPGWESPWGLFSGENPVVNMATSDVGH